MINYDSIVSPERRQQLLEQHKKHLAAIFSSAPLGIQLCPKSFKKREEELELDSEWLKLTPRVRLERTLRTTIESREREPFEFDEDDESDIELRAMVEASDKGFRRAYTLLVQGDVGAALRLLESMESDIGKYGMMPDCLDVRGIAWADIYTKEEG